MLQRHNPSVSQTLSRLRLRVADRLPPEIG
jgi:hypothetical protein